MSEVLSTLGKLCLCVAIAAGCQPEIGDSCHISDDCSQQGDRLCDTTQPGGYCTKFNCEPDACPEEATCVAFTRASLQSSACDNSPTALAGRRTFCMRRCKKDSDCRSGYECGDVGEPSNDWGASVVDQERAGRRVCIVPVQTVAVKGGEDAVCFGTVERVTGGAGAGGADALPAAAGSASDAGGRGGNGGGAGAFASGTAGRN
ncbi:MAG: hypothetical protein JW940_36400 [Polyangiaceae bacterium]|nr:hypothetical protein [Polyangiaceae bacterium]